MWQADDGSLLPLLRIRCGGPAPLVGAMSAGQEWNKGAGGGKRVGFCARGGPRLPHVLRGDAGAGGTERERAGDGEGRGEEKNAWHEFRKLSSSHIWFLYFKVN